jgi:hypothetical protein
MKQSGIEVMVLSSRSEEPSEAASQAVSEELMKIKNKSVIFLILRSYHFILITARISS